MNNKGGYFSGAALLVAVFQGFSSIGALSDVLVPQTDAVLVIQRLTDVLVPA